MRRQIMALAAAACLATTACSPNAPTTDDTVTPSAPAISTASSSPASPSESASSASSPSTSGSASASGSARTSGSPAASGSTSASGSPSTSASASVKSTEEEVDLATQKFTISADDAMKKATEKAGGGFVHSLELDWSRYHGAWVYEMDVLVGTMDHDVDINADTGEVLELDRDETDDLEKAIDLDSPMTWETARDKALGATQGRITSWKLESDEKMTSYEFDIEDSSGDEIEVGVNTATGAVSVDD